jgi:hypothetical protein
VHRRGSDETENISNRETAGGPIGWPIVDQTDAPGPGCAWFAMFTGCLQEMGAAYHLLNLEELNSYNSRYIGISPT